MTGAAPKEGSPGGDALHNMSAPPRMTIKIRPLRGSGTPPTRTLGPTSLPDFRCFARVDLDRLLRPLLAPDGRDARRARMLALVALSRQALGEGCSGVEDLADLPSEMLEDELRGRAARLDPRDLRLPAFALVRRKAGLADDVPWERDPARALALVTRVSGQLFVGNRSPRVADLAAEKAGYWFHAPWAPEGGPS